MAAGGGWIRTSNVWQTLTDVRVRVSSAWQQVTKAWIRQGGAWQEFYPAPCAGAPTANTPSVTTNSISACPSSWVIRYAWSVSGTSAAFDAELWRSTVNNPTWPTDYAFSRRIDLSSASSGYEYETQDMQGSSGGVAGSTKYRTAVLRIVPASSSNGAGPFCDDSDPSNTLSQYTEDCVT